MIHPNNKQETKIRRTLNKCIECQNIVYDYLDSFVKNNEKIPSCSDVRKWFTIQKRLKDNEIINERINLTKKEMIENHLDTLFYDVSNDALKQMVKDTYNSFVRYFKKLGQYPVRKSYKDKKKSFYIDPFKIDFTERKVKLEKIANNQKSNRQVLNYISLAEKNRIPQSVIYYNPRVNYDGEFFYITVGVSDENAPKKKIKESDGRVIGIDLNNAEIVTSENIIYKQATKTKAYKKIKRRRKRLQRALSRKYLKCNPNNSKKYKLSKNLIKNKKLIKKLDKRLTNIRDDCHDKIISHILLTSPSVIVLEDLHIKEMNNKKKRKKMTYQEKLASKNLHEASLRKFRVLLTDRIRKYDIKLVIADKYYPSTKKCSCCGNVKKMEIQDRVYVCDCCNLVINRDLNSAINLANYKK
jgi:putative transposase